MCVERVEEIRGDWDEDGFHLYVGTDESERSFRISDVETAREAIKAVDGLRDWVSEHDRELAAYRRATPEERAAVLGLAPAEDPAEILREGADHDRKARREAPRA